jgi:hypothetical protein
MLCDQLLVLSWRVADDGSKVIDEMRLIEVTELKRELGPIRPAARIELFNRFMQAIPANDPLWADADSMGAVALLKYAHRTLQELRLFYTAHLERLFMRGMVLPFLGQRDRYVVRDNL